MSRDTRRCSPGQLAFVVGARGDGHLAAARLVLGCGRMTNTSQAHRLELGDEVEIDRSLSHLIGLFDRCDRIAHLGELPPSLIGDALVAFDELVHELDRVVRDLSPETAARVGTRVRTAMLPFARRAENATRWCEKPRGYAGDYLTIANIYGDEARGDGPVGALIDRCFLRLPAALAVQHRRELLVRELKATIARCAGHPVRVTSLACGPARELFDLYTRLDEPRTMLASLIDFDPEALEHCRAESARLELDGHVDLVRANLIHVATGRRALDLAPQDLIYSIGLIDYFDDDLVVKLLDFIHTALRPGGHVMVGNFHPRNPTRAIMDHVLEWKLVHRDEADMNRLFRASAFGTACSRIVYEPQGINLFAECVRR